MSVVGGQAEHECANDDRGMGGTYDVLNMYNEQYEHLMLQDVIFLMPPPISAELHTHEQRELNTTLTLFLQPCPNESFIFPNSYVFDSGSTSSNMTSSSESLLTNVSTPPSSLVSTSRFDTADTLMPPTPVSQHMETNTFFVDLYHFASMSNTQSSRTSAHHQTYQNIETSGDWAVGRIRDIQSTSNKLLIAIIDT
jgi:hypothetical protein